MIAITGASGLIGSALVWHCNRAGRADLLLVDALGKGDKFRNLSGLNFADYLEKEEWETRLDSGALPPLEAVVHLGACSNTMEPDGSWLMRNNYGSSRRAAEYCLARGVRLIYASSAATYGDGSQGYDDDPAGLPRLRPLNKYAFSKHAFDLWALQSGALRTLTGLKYFNVFGPNEYHKGEMRSMVLKAWEQIQADGRMRLFQSNTPQYADGEQQRDFLYVKDAAAMTAWFLEHPEAAGIFNLGSGTARSWNDLARAIFAALERPPRIEYIPMPERLQRAYQNHTCAALERLRRSGCTLQARPLEEAVTDYVRNYLVSGAGLQPGDGG